MKLVTTHSEISQVGNGELEGQEVFKPWIGASIVGTEHDTGFKVETEWRKLRVEFPEALQASTRLIVLENKRTQWTTFDNLNHWFDNVIKDLLKTVGLVLNQQLQNDEGEEVSEVMFCYDTGRCIINMN